MCCHPKNVAGIELHCNGPQQDDHLDPLSPAEASLCHTEAGEKVKESAWGTMGRRKTGREASARLPSYNVGFSGRICGSVVFAKQGDHLNDLEGCYEDNSV